MNKIMINSQKKMNIRNKQIKVSYKKLNNSRLVGEKFGLDPSTILRIVKK